ncbi:hypothetical protein [Rhizobium sp. BK602]|uniref:hypothetical protein n=1 Tax=Rhizobium sp. BK602 TaxID=2586986 RepID=UPI00161B0FD8|nr:hypothetical protein [Rhizobium sp. BK602]MBB3610962.1 hypothetical protein [Rhizobium sp. BK602]
MTVLLAMWGAFISSGLAVIKIWETFFKDRLRLDKSYLLTGETGGEHEITVANLSSVPVQVSSWTLAYEPKVFRWKTKRKDVTPERYKVGGFKIDGHSSHTLLFGGEDQFEWGWKVQKGRNLCLDLHIFGRKKPKRLIIKSKI